MYILHGGVVLTMTPEQPVINNGAVVIDSTNIVAVGKFTELEQRYPSAKLLGSDDHWVLPGFINAHHHGAISGGSYRLGFVDRPLELLLLRINNSRLFEGQIEMAYLNTLDLNAQLIKSGVTCTTDFYYGDDSEPYLGAEYGLKAYKDSGMRVVLFLSARDQPSVDNGNLEMFIPLLPAALAKKAYALVSRNKNISQQQYLNAWERTYCDFHDKDGMISVCLGPDGPARCSSDFLRAIKKTAENYGIRIQMHLLETKYQMLHGRSVKGLSLVKYLHNLGFLGPEVSFAHAVWLTHEDMDVLAKSGVSVVHNASSNLRLFDGIAPVQEMISHGINVGLGTDSFGFSDDNDFLEEIRLATLLQRRPGIRGLSLSGKTALEMATVGGAQAIGMDHCIGSLMAGMRADVITVKSNRMLSPFMNPSHAPEEIMWRRCRREDICDVMINGRVVMRDGKIITIDIASVAEQLKSWHNDICTARGKYEENVEKTLNELEPFVIDFFSEYDGESYPIGYIYNTL